MCLLISVFENYVLFDDVLYWIIVGGWFVGVYVNFVCVVCVWVLLVSMMLCDSVYVVLVSCGLSWNILV